MDWSKGLSASYYAYILDPITWRETEKLNITEGSISRSEDGLRESCDVTIVGFQGTERWIRLYLSVIYWTCGFSRKGNRWDIRREYS